MADPFAIIALADTVFGLSCKLYAFFSAVHDAPEEITSLCSELQQLQMIFPAVKSYASELSISPTILQDGISQPMIACALQACESEFCALWKVVEKFDLKLSLSTPVRLLNKMAWVFKRHH